MSSFPFQRSVAKACQFIRDFARRVILERQEAVLQGDNTPPDILAHILSVAEKESSITVEDLIDDFTTFFIAGMSFSLLTHSVFISCGYTHLARGNPVSNCLGLGSVWVSARFSPPVTLQITAQGHLLT